MVYRLQRHFLLYRPEHEPGPFSTHHQRHPRYHRNSHIYRIQFDGRHNSMSFVTSRQDVSKLIDVNEAPGSRLRHLLKRSVHPTSLFRRFCDNITS